MAGLAGRQLRAGKSPLALFAMNTDGLFLDDIRVAGCAVDGIESAAVPPLVSTDVALEALGVAVRREGEVSQVIVTFDARIDFFCYTDVVEEQEDEYKNGEGAPHNLVPENGRGRDYDEIMRLLLARRTE